MSQDLITAVMRTPTVELDPNNLDPRGTGWHVIRFADANEPLVAPMIVLARQAADQDGDADWVGIARVTELNTDLQIAFLDVEWSTFHDVTPQRAAVPTGMSAAPSPGSSFELAVAV